MLLVLNNFIKVYCRILPEKQQRMPPEFGHYVLSDKLWDEIVHRWKHGSIQVARRPRHQRVHVHDRKRCGATSK